ncbi:MAG: hypothetical protein OXR73_02680 [Myxococcales bacterium]|nr:hypothetical protein [Myxococcales bacterium]
MLCAQRGVSALVFEQNRRPYGKIEDGLPRWHDKLRAKEYELIDGNLAADNVLYVPQTLVGRDLSFAQLRDDWGVSAVLLATGAWRDRSLPVPGADAFVDRGLLYQNPFVHWFNHYEEPDYDGPRYQVPDGAIVVGGGLASVDVAKIINLELYRRALSDRGLPTSVVELEHRGIGPTLASHGLSAADLGVAGATIYYRRRVADMPVAFPRDESEAAKVKVASVREKLVGVLEKKFLIRVEPCRLPVAPIEEDGRLVGLQFRRTELVDGRVKEVADSDHEVRAPLVISSIGSVPAITEGLPMKGELIDFADWDTGEVRGLPGVFGLGNALTGKGNIKDSRKSAREVTERLLADYMGLGDSGQLDADAMSGAHQGARAQAAAAVAEVVKREPLAPDRLARIAGLLEARWQAVGYGGDYRSWVAR